MDENTNLGKLIIEDMVMEMNGEEAKKLLEWIEKEHTEDVLQIGFEYNKREENDEVPQCVRDEYFGKGYVLALRHMQEELNRLTK